MAGKKRVDNYPLLYLYFYLFGNKPFAHKSANQAIVHFHSNHIQLKSSSFMQVCQFLNPEALNSISSWSFSIRDFSTLLTNHLLSNNQRLMLLIIIFFNFFSHSVFLLCYILSLNMPLQTLDFDLHHTCFDFSIQLSK